MVCAVTMIDLPVHYGRLTDIFVVVVVAVAKIDSPLYSGWSMDGFLYHSD